MITEATYRWTREAYDREVETGVFGPDDRLELIDGALLSMTPPGQPARGDRRSGRRGALRAAFGAGCRVCTQSPLVATTPGHHCYRWLLVPLMPPGLMLDLGVHPPANRTRPQTARRHDLPRPVNTVRAGRRTNRCCILTAARNTEYSQPQTRRFP